MTAGRQVAPGRSYQPGRGEKRLCWLLLACLAGISAGVLWRQTSLNPAVLVARNGGYSARPEPSQRTLVALPESLVQFGAAEHFTPENLYDKIDGKAELYLAAGFVQMNCQRFALKSSPEEWLEYFIYDMGALPQAFSVFSTQRRSEGQPLELAAFAYRTSNGLYFVSGSNYVEVVASAASESLMQAALALAKQFVADNSGSAGSLAELAWFPLENLVPASYTLQSSDAFGFAQFKNVFTAQYKTKDTVVTAFVTSCSNQIAAAALAGDYRSFLLANGGKETPQTELTGTHIDIMDGTEIVFVEGAAVAGVHAAPSAAAAEQVARQLRTRLAASARPGNPPGSK